MIVFLNAFSCDIIFSTKEITSIIYNDEKSYEVFLGKPIDFINLVLVVMQKKNLTDYLIQT